jgi:5-methylcytosine-specific restriction endonuclease McrA
MAVERRWRSDTDGQTDNPPTADHIVAKANGGTDDPSNLRVLCLRCNSAKRDRPLSITG